MLVRRHVDFVHSAAMRMVCDPHLAEDVTQAVFMALARDARPLADRAVLSGWLHRTTQNLAANVVRTAVRRRAREQEAAAMFQLLSDSSDSTWEQVAPHLDTALGELSDSDRDALLLRYFERKSAREMAQALGISAEAAQRRVTRAVERLRECFLRRGVTASAGGLATAMAAHAVQAAPVGLSASIATAVTTAGTIVSAVTTTTSVSQAIAMTTLQKTLVGTALAAALSVAIYQTREAARLRELGREQASQHVALSEEIEGLKRERTAAHDRLAALEGRAVPARTNATEVAKLRGQVGVLRQEKAELGRKSGLTKVTADPVARKALRDAQKLGMKSVYEGLTTRLDLAPELREKFHDVLADGIMEGIDLVTQSLQEKSSPAEIDRQFAAQESDLRDKVAALLGPDGLKEFRDYSTDVAGTLTVMEFEPRLTGEKAAKAEKKRQLLQALKEETGTALAGAGLPADYQPLPMLNFRNIASEETAEQSLALLGGVFERVAVRAGAFLSPEEVTQLQAFGKKVLENNRTMLLMNRKMMAPIAE